MRKAKKKITLALLCVMGLLLGYVLCLPGRSASLDSKDNPIAIILHNQDGSTVTSVLKPNLAIYSIDANASSCDNNSVITANTDGTLSIKFLGNDHCTLHYNQRPAQLSISNITINGTSNSNIPTKPQYNGSASCTGATASWNNASWTLDVSAISSSNATCSLTFTSPSGNNFATYITNLLGSNTQVTSATDSLATTGILKNEGDYGIRYEGPNPNNYVLFNNELWRIIGVFDTYTSVSDWTNKTNAVKRVKLIRNDSIGSFAFDRTTSRSTTTNGNAWSYGGRLSNIAQILNGPYLNHRNGSEEKDARSSSYYMCMFYGNNSVRTACDFSKGGIQGGYDDMIESVVWHLRGYSSATYTQSMYNYERTGTVNSSADTEWVGKVGLMYPSDYGYSALVDNCSRTGVQLSNYYSTPYQCANTSWILKYGYEWTISPNSSNASSVWNLFTGGNVNYDSANSGYAVRPSIYLSSNTYYISGDGSKSNPYVIIGA